MAAKGVKTVINLRTQREMDNRQQVPYDEAALAKELGITYVHIPLGGPDTPYTPEAVEKFAKAFEDANTQGAAPLHCRLARQPHVDGLSGEAQRLHAGGSQAPRRCVNLGNAAAGQSRPAG